MIAAGIVLGWVVLVVGIVAGVAYVMRKAPVPPPRDSELPSTQPAVAFDADSEPWPAGAPGRVWRDTRPPWVNTVPTGPVPFDESPGERRP